MIYRACCNCDTICHNGIKYRDNKGYWDRKSYLCKKCYGYLKTYGTLDKGKVRNKKEEYLKWRIRKKRGTGICCVCRKNETYIDPSGKEIWRGHECDRQDCTGSLCFKCYRKSRGELRKSCIVIWIDIKIISYDKDICIDDIHRVPTCCGVYIITDVFGDRYVGSSNDISNRISDHKSNHRIVAPVKLIDYYETKDVLDARILEYYFIRKLSPELNRESCNNLRKPSIFDADELILSLVSPNSPGFCPTICIDIKIVSYDTNICVDDIHIVPNCCGVYIITDIFGDRYIGSSNGVSNRISNHKSNHRDPRIVAPVKLVDYYETKDLVSARILEYYFIRKLSPELNREFG